MVSKKFSSDYANYVKDWISTFNAEKEKAGANHTKSNFNERFLD